MRRSTPYLLSLLVCSTALGCGSSSDEDEQDKSQNPSEDPSDDTKTKDKKNPSEEPDPSKETSGSGEDEETTQESETDTTDPGSDDTSTKEPGDPGKAEEVCKRYKKAFADEDEGQWSGDVGSCEAGDINKEARQAALDRINFIRWLAQLSEVTTDPALDKKAQACALMMHANSSLSHNPPKSWKCYTDEGASAAGKSNISSAPGVSSVLLYMIDPGNPTTIGHRRWIIANRFGPTGLGTTSKSSCMFTIGGKQNGDRVWTAWPPPGVFPIELNSNGWSSMDSTGWTIQSDTIAFDGKTITVKANGEEKPVDIAQLLPNFGARNTVKITPKGWKMQAGTKYEVKVQGTDIDYAFEAVSCK